MSWMHGYLVTRSTEALLIVFTTLQETMPSMN